MYTTIHRFDSRFDSNRNFRFAGLYSGWRRYISSTNSTQHLEATTGMFTFFCAVAWLWILVQAVNRTSGRSGSASEDDPAERGCSRLRTTLGSTPTTPGGSHMTASLGGRTTRGRSSVPLTDWMCVQCLVCLLFILIAVASDFCRCSGCVTLSLALRAYVEFCALRTLR